MFRYVSAIPVLGAISKIVNNYVYGGDYRASTELAPLRLWLRAFLVPVSVAIFLSLLTLGQVVWEYFAHNKINFDVASDFVRKPGALIASVIPCLLGFGIGVYALIFALAEPFVKQFSRLIDEKRETGAIRHGSALMLNSDLAFPLITLVLGLGFAVIQQAYEKNETLISMAWVVFWYCMVVTIEVIAVIFRLAEHSIMDKSMDSNGTRN